jgi:hypothetical protein
MMWLKKWASSPGRDPLFHGLTEFVSGLTSPRTMPTKTELIRAHSLLKNAVDILQPCRSRACDPIRRKHRGGNC